MDVSKGSLRVEYVPISLWTCWGIPMMVVLLVFFLVLLSGFFRVSVLFRGLKVEAGRDIVNVYFQMFLIDHGKLI